ncbi:hypothetical protein B9Z19DRAFT_1142632 [Tuber borchii]|uniref:Uncharacterized protein n=1 Tax=Tuber borchii TaxID=42251 RepID=A0A2T7A6T1_TUBBO|nr:hypothetical protein B9Z19DRAFT_1142632 [Tuber borchii]
MLRLFSKRAHLAPYPFIRKPLEPRRFLMATGNVHSLSKVEQIQEAASDAKPGRPIPGGDCLDFKTMEGNIIKAIRELSSRTDTSITNTRRELISQMVKAHRELDSEMAQNHRKLELKIAQHYREVDSKMAQHDLKLEFQRARNHRELKNEMASNHRELKHEMGSNHRELKYGIWKLDTIEWFVYFTFLLSGITFFAVCAH